MNDSGIEEIKKRILEQHVYTPSDMTIKDLVNWLAGYNACREAITKVLEEFKSGR